MPIKPPRACSRCGAPVTNLDAHMRDVHGRIYQSRKRPSAARRGYSTTWKKIRIAKLRKNPYCEDPYAVHDGLLVPATEVDHIKTLRSGGTHADSNLQSLCNDCHERKTNTEDGGGWQRKGRGVKSSPDLL